MAHFNKACGEGWSYPSPNQVKNVNTGSQSNNSSIIENMSSRVHGDANGEHGNRAGNASSSSNKKRSISQPVTGDRKRQARTTNENSMSDDNIITVIPSSPLVDKASAKVDRHTTLSNCFGKTFCLLLHGMIPKNIQMEMTMTCQDKNENYCFSFYEFEVYDHLQKKQYVKTWRLPVKLIKIDENIYKIEIDGICIYKQPNITNQEVDSNKKKSNKLFLYPSGGETEEQRKGPTRFVKNNQCNCLQLALRFFDGDKLLPIRSNYEVKDQTILLLNKIQAVSDFTYAMNAPTINADNSKQFLKIFSSWNYHYQNCEMNFLMKVPREFHKMLDYGDIWISTSLVDKNNEPNRIYYFYADGIFYDQIHLIIDKALFKEDGYKEEKYYNLGSRTIGRKPLAELRENLDMRKKFEIYDNSVWCTLSDTDLKKMFASSGLNAFRLQLKVSCDIKLADMHFQLPIDDLPPWLSDEFTEDVFNDPSVQQSSGFVESDPINVDALSLTVTGEGLIGIGDSFLVDTVGDPNIFDISLLTGIVEGPFRNSDPFLSGTIKGLNSIDISLLTGTVEDPNSFDISLLTGTVEGPFRNGDAFLSGTIEDPISIDISLLTGTVENPIGIDLNSKPDYSLGLPTTRATTQKT